MYLDRLWVASLPRASAAFLWGETMRAGILRNGTMVIDDIPELVAGPRHVLCSVRSCGICGSDLHTISHGDVIVRSFNERPASEPAPDFQSAELDFGRDIVLGHEFCAEVVELGPDVDNIAVGDLLVSVPAIVDGMLGHGLGFSNTFPGGFSQRMLLSADLALKVPNGLHHGLAALTEPAAVGEHVVNLAALSERDGALVLGAGPVGRSRSSRRSVYPACSTRRFAWRHRHRDSSSRASAVKRTRSSPHGHFAQS
jgi:threonine dehydrogenase-like Zn-dependent dehydrogenase